MTTEYMHTTNAENQQWQQISSKKFYMHLNIYILYVGTYINIGTYILFQLNGNEKSAKKFYKIRKNIKKKKQS